MGFLHAGLAALIALDWTEFDPDDHITLCAYLVTTHGRATPLCWQTVRKSLLSDGRRTEIEIALVERLGRAIAPEVAITLLADRGFGNQQFYQVLEQLGWYYIIRFRGNITVTHAGESRPARAWLPASGRATKLAGAQVTDARTPIGAVVVVHAKQMKEPWCLATNLAALHASAIVKLYGRRFTIEETFRDQKDLRFGMGLRQTRIRKEAPPRPAAHAPGPRPGTPHPARRCLRALRPRCLSQGQHCQAAYPLPLSPGHLLVRMSPHHAR